MSQSDAAFAAEFGGLVITVILVAIPGIIALAIALTALARLRHIRDELRKQTALLSRISSKP